MPAARSGERGGVAHDLAWSIGAFAVAATLTVGLWIAAHQLAQRSWKAQTRVIAGQVGERIRACVHTRIEMLSQIRREWALGGMHDDVEFALRAEGLLSTFPGYLAVNQIDEQGRISLVHPPAPNQRALGRRITDTPGAGAAYQQAIRDGELRVTAPIELFQSGTGIAVYVPTAAAGTAQTVLNGVFRADTLIPACLAADDVDDYALTIRDENALVYARREVAEVPELAATTTLPLFNRRWTLRAAPGRDHIDAAIKPIHLILVGGLPLSAAIGGVLFLLLTIRNRARERAWRADVQRLEERERVEAKLQHVQRMEMLGKLAASVAHDFNNLLTVIIASTHVLNVRQGEDQEVVKDIEQAAQRGAALTRELVTFGRGDTRPVTTLDLGELLRSWQGMLARLTGTSIKLDVRAPASALRVRGAAVHFEQIVMNLVVNAIAAMPDGGTLVVEATRAGDTAILAIEDTGSGIDPAVVPRIFEPFFTTKAPGEGTGLGLATVYGNVHRMNGEITVESELGRGTRFIATFPTVPAAS